MLQLQTPWEQVSPHPRTASQNDQCAALDRMHAGCVGVSQFDSIFRIIDRGKSGTVHLAELLRAFTYPPLPTSIGCAPTAFSSTELLLLCFTLAIDAPLADSAPFTTTIQQCADRAVELPGSSSSGDAAHTGRVLTPSTIAALLADWVERGLRSSQRQPHRHHRMPKALSSSLKALLDDNQRRQVCEHFAKLFRVYLTESDGSVVAQVSAFAALLYTFVLFRLSSLRSDPCAPLLLPSPGVEFSCQARSDRHCALLLHTSGTSSSRIQARSRRAKSVRPSTGSNGNCKGTSRPIQRNRLAQQMYAAGVAS